MLLILSFNGIVSSSEYSVQFDVSPDGSRIRNLELEVSHLMRDMERLKQSSACIPRNSIDEVSLGRLAARCDDIKTSVRDIRQAEGRSPRGLQI